MRAALGLASLGLALGVATGVFAAEPKNCYEQIGCPWKEEAKLEVLRTLACENLAHVRNQLYHENGYCFRTAAAKALYGNKGCRYPATGFVPLNPIERGNIAKIRRVERDKNCKS